MKRKTKRTGKKKLAAFFISFSALSLLFNFLKDSIKPFAIPLIKSCFNLDDKSKLDELLLYGFFFIIIASFSLFFYKLYLRYNKPSKKYFELTDFEKPTDAVLKKATEGILNSEKAKPFFVHVAPINDEIVQFNQALDQKGFVWVNGKPGDGKTMLAYHALYRYRKSIKFTYGVFSILLLKLKYKVYSVSIDKILSEKEIDQILDELDALKGGKRKIILIDDAHKLTFENQLR
jgi:hypothetical protein